MRRVPDEVRAALTVEQLQAIRQAVFDSRPGQNHSIDIRVTLPLFFVRYYLILQSGRDRRSATRNAEDRRRRAANQLFDWTVIAVVLFNVIQVVFLILYFIKSFLGINLFPHDHLIDFIPDF
jgi:uncharacterized membrane protein YidH (DUF202 family)